MNFFITGTDTDIGKTVAASWLMLHLNADYWKPVQSGLPADIDTAKELTELPDSRFHNETYRLSQPLSPHEAARRDNITIDLGDFKIPKTNNPVVIEGAGGLMVPINDEHMVIDLIKTLSAPAILVCRSGLGTINHTLLSIEALKNRNIPVAGLIISGPKTPHNRQALEQFSGLPVIAELDHLDPLNKESLLTVKPEIDLLNQDLAA